MELQDFINSRASLRLDSKHQKYQDILDSALAKSERNWRTGESTEPQSYFTHVTDVYLVWRQLIDLHRPTIDRIATNAGLTTERILQSSLLCVAFHDFGKLSSNFQDMMNATSKTAYRSAQRRNYRHEIISLPLVDYFAQKLNEKHGHVLTDGHLEALAVAGHHRFLADDYLFNSERYHQLIRWDDYGIDDAIVASSLFAQVMFSQLGWELPITKSIRNQRELLSNKSENVPFARLKAARDACLDDDNHPRFRNVFAVLKGLLMVADWRASSGIEFPEMLNAASGSVVIPTTSLLPFVKSKVENAGKKFQGFRAFQKECGESAGHVLAIAPTGSGKTEAAFLWALNQVESGVCQKVFFLLPTMVTANSLYDRAKAFFKDEYGHEVGLIHSTADLVRADKNINGDDEQDMLTVQGGPLAERHFFNPVTIGTVDQLLNSLFHAGRWPLKTFAAMNAAIVIDEIHAYDPHTAGLISLMLTQISEAGGRFMVMSATMPEDMKAIVRQSLTSKHPLPLHEVSDHELLDSA
ncbi:MAG: CRISPR-associated helicase Cas3' [Pirellulaceae bacterium]